MSTREAEYIAASNAIKEALCMRQVSRELGRDSVGASQPWCDQTGSEPGDNE